MFRNLLLPLFTLFVLPFAASGAQEPAPVRVEVRGANGGLLPSRLTVVGPDGTPAAIRPLQTRAVACRPGVLYTGTGAAEFSLPEGRYQLYVTRGPEYGLVTRSLQVEGRPVSLQLRLNREVDSRGYVSCDTHVHTLTFSGHGDCTAEERMATLAGEDVALPVAAEHNRSCDYGPLAQAAGLRSLFTPVIGDEVTTPVGHFIAFPLKAESPPPDYRLQDRTTMAAAARARPEAPVLILNHPRDAHGGFRPADPSRFHPLSGESLDGHGWEFDGIEVVNSGALQSDFMQPYRDWFALLNYGHRIVGIGASDSHDVTRSIVGQGRTYIASAASRRDGIDTAEICRALRAGKALVSMGLLTRARVEERFEAGDLATGLGETMKVRVQVQSPGWVQPDRVELYQNGDKVAGRHIEAYEGVPTRRDLVFTLPRPRYDAWLVAIASGPGVTAPYWPFSRPYQPTRADWEPRAIGSTSPIRIDGDGDGRYSSPRDLARAAVEASGADPGRLMSDLAKYDAAVAVQAASLCRARKVDLTSVPFRAALDRAVPQVRQGFVAYQNVLGGVRD